MDLKYSNLSKEQILADLKTIVDNSPDSKWKEAINSKYGQFQTDIFASFVDVANYNVNRGFEETFSETAKLDESLITLSHDKGYDIQRSIPAKSKITPSTKNIDKFSTTDKIVFHAGTSFSVDDIFFTLTKDVTVTINGSTFSVSSPDFNSLEGVFKTDTVSRDEFSAFFFNTFASEKASNIFGDVVGLSDDIYEFCNMSIGEVDENGDDVILYTYEVDDGEGGFTSTDIYSYIIQRTMSYNAYDIMLGYNDIDPYNNGFESSYDLSLYLNTLEAESDKILPLCYVRTSRDKMLELCFGDGRVIRFPRNDLKVKYFVSNGSQGARNIINKKATLFKRNITVYQNGDSNGIHRDEDTPNAIVDDLMNYVDFVFETNSINGIDMESGTEIASNMESFFSMQDRLVTDKDYNSFFGRGLYKKLNLKFWGEQVETDYFQDISPYNNNSVMINYKGINDDIFNNLGGNNSVDVAGLIFSNLEGFSSKYYIDDGSFTLPPQIIDENKIELTDYTDYLYMYYLREIMPIKLLSQLKNDNMKTNTIDNASLLTEMYSIVENTGNLALNYVYVPSIVYSNVQMTMDITIQGSQNAIQGKSFGGTSNSLYNTIRTTVESMLTNNRGIETSKITNKLNSEFRFISNIETNIAINESETTVSDILNNTVYGNNIFEDNFISMICASNTSIYDLFKENGYFNSFPSIKSLIGFESDSINQVEGFKNRISAKRLSSLYRELFRFLFVVKMNGYLSSLTVDDIYSRVNSFYEFTESKMRYDVIKNIAVRNTLDYTAFTLPNEFFDIDTASNDLTINLTYNNLK